MINYANYTGLNNIGNTCYMNAALQLVANNNDLISYFVSNNFTNTNLNIVKNFLVKYKSTENSFAPKELKAVVGNRNKIFGGYMQNDSHEFLIFLFDIIEESLKEEFNHGDSFSKDKPVNKIANLFDHKLVSTLKCKIKNCDNISKNISFNRFLSLEIPSGVNITLDDCYRFFKSREKLEEDERWFCDKCKKKRISSKRLEIDTWPKHMFIQLKRFNARSSGRVTKNNTFIDIPFEWRHNYILNGFIIHSGGVGGGHYISVFCVNNIWILFDDRRTNELSLEQVKKMAACAYILYYKQLDL